MVLLLFISLLIVTPIVGFCNCSMFCCAFFLSFLVLYNVCPFAIILMRKRELVALLSLSFWCLVIVVWLFPMMPWVCLQFVMVLFPDHTHYFGVHVQRMLKLRNVYTLAKILNKSVKGNWGPWKFCLFQYTNSTCNYNNIFRVCFTSLWNFCPNIEEK